MLRRWEVKIRIKLDLRPRPERAPEVYPQKSLKFIENTYHGVFASSLMNTRTSSTKRHRRSTIALKSTHQTAPICKRKSSSVINKLLTYLLTYLDTVSCICCTYSLSHNYTEKTHPVGGATYCDMETLIRRAGMWIGRKIERWTRIPRNLPSILHGHCISATSEHLISALYVTFCVYRRQQLNRVSVRNTDKKLSYRRDSARCEWCWFKVT